MVTLNLTLNTPEQLHLTAEYLKGLANLSMDKGQEQIADKPKKQTASKPKSEKAEEQPQPKVEEVVEEKPAVEEKAEEVTNKESEIKISDLRTLLSKKVDEHRDDIKAKLTELGAKNVTTLDESKYEDFHAFLKDLK
jgi:non-homologous end joining protein Ku